MSNVIRVFVEKREGFDVEARHMLSDLRENLGMKEITSLRLLNRYDVEGLSAEEFARARDIVFSEPNADDVYDETFAAGEGFERYENISAICDKKVCKKRKILLAATRCLVSARAACFFTLKLRRKPTRIMPAEE